MIDLGSVYPASVTITDSSGNPANATTVTITITLPDLTTVGPTSVTPASTGVYEYDYATVQAGRHVIRWVATGTNASAYTDVFDVAPAASAAIVSLADAKAKLGVTNTTDDDLIRGYIQAATEVCNAEVGYTAPTAVTETVGQVGTGARQTITLSHTPILSITSVTAQMQSLPAPDLTYEIINAQSGTVYLSNWWPFIGPLTVSYVAGRASIPFAVRTACLLIVEQLYRTQRGGAIAVPPGTMGAAVETVDGVVIPIEAALLLKEAPYYAAPGMA